MWLPLAEYSMKHKVSISTLRRKIKAADIQYRLDDGKYLILDSAEEHRPSLDTTGRETALAENKNSNEEVYCNSLQEAYEWMFSHKHWVLKKREVINWTFPLEQIVSQECWVKIE